MTTRMIWGRLVTTSGRILPSSQNNTNPPGTGGHKPGTASKITFSILNASDTTTNPSSFSALADLNTGRPTLTGGGAKWNTIDLPQRAGLTVFAGYDPLQLTVPLLFDAFIDGDSVEADIDLLWKMWGRGPGAANTAQNKQAPVVVLDGDLLPRMVRFGSVNPAPPNWVITNIQEDAASALHNGARHVVRLAVVVTLEEFNTSSALASLGGATSTARTKVATYTTGTTMREVANRQRTTVTNLRDLNNYGSNDSLDRYLRDPSLKFKKTLRVKVPRVTA